MVALLTEGVIGGESSVCEVHAYDPNNDEDKPNKISLATDI